MIKHKLTLIVAGLAILASAIGQTDWVPISTKDGFLTLRFPAGWSAVDQDSVDFKKTIENLRKNNPALAKLLEKADTKDLSLEVFDLSDDPTDGSDNMNVKVAKNPGIKDKDLGEVGKAMVQNIPFKGKKEYKVIDMPMGKTLTYWGTMEAKLEDGRMLEIQILGYLYLRSDKMVVCTFTTSNGKLAKLRETFEKIMKSAKH